MIDNSVDKKVLDYQSRLITASNQSASYSKAVNALLLFAVKQSPNINLIKKIAEEIK
jgi:hypothetical protein